MRERERKKGKYLVVFLVLKVCFSPKPSILFIVFQEVHDDKPKESRFDKSIIPSLTSQIAPSLTSQIAPSLTSQIVLFLTSQSVLK
jgi:hypothetical protein